MAAPHSVRRPAMTSKQAKAAYKKLSGPVILEGERRRLKRAAELRERAEKIREKEKKKQINRTKKAEREEKEREKQALMGTDRVHSLVRFPSSQLELGKFFGGGRRRETNARSDEDVPETDGYLQVIDEVNQLPGLETTEDDVVATAILETKDSHNEVKSYDTSDTHQPEKLMEEDWIAFLPSNTQVAREIAHPIGSIRSTSPLPCSRPVPNRQIVVPTATEAYEATAIACSSPIFSTQDLTSIDEKIEALEGGGGGGGGGGGRRGNSQSATPKPRPTSEVFSRPVIDWRDRSSMGRPSQHRAVDLSAKKSSEFGDFEISTQDLRDLAHRLKA